jgi:hypothetical protein
MIIKPVESLLCLALLGYTGAASAAETYDNCTGFITSLPAVITRQGTWCMNEYRAYQRQRRHEQHQYRERRL